MKQRPYIDYFRRLSMESKLISAYERHRNRLVLWLRRMGVRTLEDAEDLAGQVWVELLGAVRSRRLSKWSDAIVYYVARHRLLDHFNIERNRARLTQLRGAELAWLLPNWNLSNVSDIDSDIPVCGPDLDDAILVCKLVASLPDDERAVVEDLYLYGRTLKESASKLSVSTSTVKRLQSTALKWMRSKVG